MLQVTITCTISIDASIWNSMTNLHDYHRPRLFSQPATHSEHTFSTRLWTVRRLKEQKDINGYHWYTVNLSRRFWRFISTHQILRDWRRKRRTITSRALTNNMSGTTDQMFVSYNISLLNSSELVGVILKITSQWTIIVVIMMIIITSLFLCWKSSTFHAVCLIVCLQFTRPSSRIN